jgi:hypothetical protein
VFYDGNVQAPVIAALESLRQRVNADLVVILANTSEYGGCAAPWQKLSVITASAPAALLAHELGHSLFNLADEYQGNSCYYTTSEAANVTKNLNALPWHDLLTTNQIPTNYQSASDHTVGAFEGAAICNHGVYRPVKENCLMRQLNAPFCPVCEREMHRFFQKRGYVKQVDASSDGADEEAHSQSTNPDCTEYAGGSQAWRTCSMREGETIYDWNSGLSLVNSSSQTYQIDFIELLWAENIAQSQWAEFTLGVEYGMSYVSPDWIQAPGQKFPGMGELGVAQKWPGQLFGQKIRADGFTTKFRIPSGGKAVIQLWDGTVRHNATFKVKVSPMDSEAAAADIWRFPQWDYGHKALVNNCTGTTNYTPWTSFQNLYGEGIEIWGATIYANTPNPQNNSVDGATLRVCNDEACQQVVAEWTPDALRHDGSFALPVSMWVAPGQWVNAGAWYTCSSGSGVWNYVMNVMVKDIPAPSRTQCWIHNTACPSHPNGTGWFMDDWDNGGNNPQRCLARAQEYADWCGMLHGEFSEAVFKLDGNYVTMKTAFGK